MPKSRSAPKGAASERSLDRSVDRWLATLGSENTRQAYRRDLEVFRAWLAARSLAFREVDGNDVEAFRTECEAAGASPSTVNRRVSAIASFHRFAATSRGDVDPTKGVTRRAVPASPSAALSAAQAARVWKAAEALGARSAVIVGLVLFNGWKSHELLAVDADAVQADRRSVRIGGGAPLDPRTATAVRTHLAGRSAGPLLYGENPTRTPTRLTRFGVDYIVKRVGAHAGIVQPLTVNVLRATHQALRDVAERS